MKPAIDALFTEENPSDALLFEALTRPSEFGQQRLVCNHRYALAVESASDGIWDWDLKTNKVYYSSRWQSLLGLATHERIHNSPNEWLSRIHPDDKHEFEHKLQTHLQHPQHQKFRHEYRLRHADGNYRWVLTYGMALWDKAGNAYRFAGSQTDITERKALEKELHHERELARITLHSIDDAVITTDEQGNIKDFNPVAERLTGWIAADAKHQPITKVCRLVDGKSKKKLNNSAIQAIKQAIKTGQVHTLGNRHPTLISQTGEVFALGKSAAPIHASSGDVIGAVLVFHNVTEQQCRTEQLTWQAAHDPITHLLNRQTFVESVDRVIDEARAQQTHHVLCSMDLEQFKAVNDICGHAAGDRLLRQVADLWHSKIRTSDSLARLSGDEFGLLLYGCDLERAIAIAHDLCQSTKEFRFACKSKLFSVGVSIGLVPINHDSIHTKEVMQLADNACHQAKHQGKNQVRVNCQSESEAAQQSTDSQWFSRITRALDNNLFVLYEQAISAAQTGSTDVELCEILLRLPVENKRANGLSDTIMPIAFLPTAEKYDLMPKIDRWVVSQCLAHISEQNQPLENRSKLYSINLSGSSLNDESFIGFLKEQLQQHPKQAKLLCFEITETVAISNLQRVASFILEMKQLGCLFALDDFGSGMSSFNYLKNLPVDFLKIDGNFVKEAPVDEMVCAMLEAINQVGHVMGLKTIAEYVENQSILQKVKDLGIDYVQGYEIQRPRRLA
ncbi:MAG: EAL domain-containing protein [Cyanobacteria bacterium P01_D01_bin.36]